MAVSNSFQTLSEIAKERAKKQPHQIDQILEEAPILARLKFEVSTHDMHNVAEEITDVQGAAFVPMNAVLPHANVATRLSKVDLSIMGCEAEVAEDTAQQFGGKEAYFNKRLPSIHKKMGMDTERAIIYNNWKPFSVASGNAQNAGAKTGGVYSMYAIRLTPGEHCGLYSPKGFGQGTVLNVMALSGGTLYKSMVPATVGVNVYGLRMKAYLGWQILNKRTCAAIFNINPDNIPTQRQINAMLASVRATGSGNTMLVCHQHVLDLLGEKYKDKALQMGIEDKDFNTQISRWSGVPLYTTYNMDEGTEAVVPFA